MSNTLYQRFNEESVSHSHISLWLKQFNPADHPPTLFLAGLIGYWGCQREHFDLRTLHNWWMKQCHIDGFISNLDNEDYYSFSDK